MPERPKKSGTKTAPSAPPPYKGELASPIVEPLFYAGLDGGAGSIPPHKGPLSRYEAQQRVFTKRAQKLDLLFEWYQIDKKSDGRWLELSIALALAHVPGMMVAAEETSKSSFWKDGGFRALVKDVDEAFSRDQGPKRGRITRALEQLVNDPNTQWHRRDPNALSSRYREARRLVRRHAAKEKLENDALESFRRELQDILEQE